MEQTIQQTEDMQKNTYDPAAPTPLYIATLILLAIIILTGVAVYH